MKMFISILLISLFVGSISFAAIRPYYQDIKLPTQVLLEHQDFTDPAAAGTDEVLSTEAGMISEVAVIQTTFDAQPDVSRNLILTPGGTSADIEACTVVVVGTNQIGGVISENFTMGSTMSTAITGVQAFKTVVSVTFPVECEKSPWGGTYDLGYGEAIGLNRCLANVGDLAWTTVDGAYESTRATAVVDDNEVSKNTLDFNGTMNGANDFQAFYIQNFNAACQP